MQHTRGKYVIFADADGASKFEDLGKLSNELKRIEKDGLGVAVGSRAHMVHSAAVVQVHSQPPKTHISIFLAHTHPAIPTKLLFSRNGDLRRD